jgi:hypothetical protein
MCSICQGYPLDEVTALHGANLDVEHFYVHLVGSLDVAGVELKLSHQLLTAN